MARSEQERNALSKLDKIRTDQSSRVVALQVRRVALMVGVL